jgi:hypothetical protein
VTAPRIVIATPMRDWMVTGPHHASAWELAQSTELVPPKLLIDDDLSKTRARAVRYFLSKTEGTHLLFWDADVEGNVAVLRGMLSEGVGCIGATYPRKRIDPDGRCRHFAVYTRGEKVSFEGNRARVAAIGLGYMLLERSLLAQMWTRFEDELYAYDEAERTVMLFHLSFGENSKGRRIEWPEDYSFCERVRTLTDVWLYTGEGSPLAHVGMHVFRGSPEDVHPRSGAA